MLVTTSSELFLADQMEEGEGALSNRTCSRTELDRLVEQGVSR